MPAGLWVCILYRVINNKVDCNCRGGGWFFLVELELYGYSSKHEIPVGDQAGGRPEQAEVRKLFSS